MGNTHSNHTSNAHTIPHMPFHIKRNQTIYEDSIFESETVTPSPTNSFPLSSPYKSAYHVDMAKTKYSPPTSSRSSITTSNSSSKISYEEISKPKPSYHSGLLTDMDSKAASLLGTSTTDHSRPSNMSTIRNDNESHYQCIDDRYYWKGNSTVDFSLPCDTTEGERLATMHHMFKSILQGNFISPVRDVLSNTRANVLDIGCGNGTWVLEMSNEFPNTEFFGIDECPLFPKSNKPPNTHFVQHNVLSPFPFNANQFDFIYMRSMILYYTPAQLVTLLSDISRILKPGGYLEVLDTTYMINKPGSLSDSLINHQLYNILLSQPSSSRYETMMNHPIFTLLMIAPQTSHSTSSFVGNYVDIHQEHFNIPLGWGGRLGGLHAENYDQLLSSIKLKYADHCMINPEEIHTILTECKRNKSYLDYFSCYARKPMNQGPIEQNTLESIYEFVEGYIDEY